VRLLVETALAVLHDRFSHRGYLQAPLSLLKGHIAILLQILLLHGASIELVLSGWVERDDAIIAIFKTVLLLGVESRQMLLALSVELRVLRAAVVRGLRGGDRPRLVEVGGVSPRIKIRLEMLFQV